MKKGIEFADETWNPVWGCNNKCPYCFARPIAKRFGYEIIEKEWNYRHNKGIYSNDLCFSDGTNFIPTFLYSQLEKKFKKNTTHVFVNSMSDIMYWKPDWWQLVLEQVKKYPDKKFIFFTKDSNIGLKISDELPENCVIIFTVNNFGEHIRTRYDYLSYNLLKGMCYEPLQGRIADSSVQHLDSFADWVIIGAETGNRKNKIEVQKEWLEPFYDLKIPVFMKESIRHLVPPEKFRQERI